MSVAVLPVSVDLPDEKFVKPQRSIHSEAEVSALIDRALDRPLDYPPLKESVFAGDKVVIVLHADLPRPNEMIDALGKYLRSANVSPTDVTILTTMNLETGSSNELTGATFVVHDPNDEQGVAYLAASTDGDPLYVNRQLFEADVILPVNCVSPVDEFSDDCIYPRFSSAATITRYRRGTGSNQSRQRESALANDQLGIFISAQVITGPGGLIQDVVFGQKDLAEKVAREKAAGTWSVAHQAASQIVVATIESNPHQQNWQQFCHAVIAADQIASDCGQIVVCSEIAERPGKNIRKILQLQFETDSEVATKVLKNASPTLRQVAEVLAEKTVFLQSRLSEAEVEDLGLGCISSSEELQRLVDRVESGVLLRDAHLCRVV